MRIANPCCLFAFTLAGVAPAGTMSYCGSGIPIKYLSNQLTIFSSRSTRCHGCPLRESSWLSPGNRTIRSGHIRRQRHRHQCRTQYPLRVANQFRRSLQHPIPPSWPIHRHGRKARFQEVRTGGSLPSGLRQARPRRQASSRSACRYRNRLRSRATPSDRKRHPASRHRESHSGKRPIRWPQPLRAAVRRARCRQSEHLLGLNGTVRFRQRQRSHHQRWQDQ